MPPTVTKLKPESPDDLVRLTLAELFPLLANDDGREHVIKEIGRRLGRVAARRLWEEYDGVAPSAAAKQKRIDRRERRQREVANIARGLAREIVREVQLLNKPAVDLG